MDDAVISALHEQRGIEVQEKAKREPAGLEIAHELCAMKGGQLDHLELDDDQLLDDQVASSRVVDREPLECDTMPPFFAYTKPASAQAVRQELAIHGLPKPWADLAMQCQRDLHDPAA